MRPTVSAEQRAFVDKALLPSIRQVQDTSRFSVCLDFANAARNGVGRALNKMVTEDLQSLINAMRCAIRVNNLIGFDDFFLVLYSHRIKIHIPMPIPAGHNGSLVEYGLRHQHIDFALVDHFNLYVDLALSFKLVQHHPEGVTGLWVNYENLVVSLTETQVLVVF